MQAFAFKEVVPEGEAALLWQVASSVACRDSDQGTSPIPKGACDASMVQKVTLYKVPDGQGGQALVAEGSLLVPVEITVKVPEKNKPLISPH
jgi:hypothetical protein